jgi:pyruvate formate lyase activating enzyme
MVSRRSELEPGVVRGELHTRLDNGKLRCDLCPRACTLGDGQRGFCFVRQARDDAILLTTYGRSTGFCIDPIEKKPLNHFYPGTSILSFGTAGCNLGCRFCQNWESSKARKTSSASSVAYPEEIARAAAESGCSSVAFTYNDPVIFFEYAIDAARACREVGVRSVAVTAGYIEPGAREQFFGCMDAANVDLKGFSDSFYHKMCAAHLQPVLDTLVFLARETDVWMEVTTLLIPGENDSQEELARMCDWLVENVGPEVPLHFSAFHPDFKLRNKPRTPAATLTRARELARAAGLHHVFTGNVFDPAGQSTFCPSCRALLIERDGYTLGHWDVRDGGCGQCGTPLAGRFADSPGGWGARRQPVRF